MSSGKMIWLKLTLIMSIIATLVTACNFPLFNQTQNVTSDSDIEATLVALQQTANALQAGKPAPTEDPALMPTATNTVEPSITPTTEIAHLITPMNPNSNRESGMTDANSSAYATQRKVVAGENFAYDFFERPFNSDPMDVYFPDLDITKGTLNHNTPWTFVMIKMVGASAEGGLQKSYGVEFDLDVDGRGDVLVFVKNPGASWSVSGVQIWKDTNKNVGNVVPVEGDNPQTGDGYDQKVFDAGVGSDPDAAWARIDPLDPASVQIAIKNDVVNNDPAYTWGAWVKTEFQPEWFDYNDHFSLIEAGSPLTYQSQAYPLKAFSEVDNTCRWSVGFTPKGNEPGICPVPATATPTATSSSTASPGMIIGFSWYDLNGDGIKAFAEPRLGGAGIRLQSGSCSSPGAVIANTTTNGSGDYSFSGITPGTYCVGVSSNPGGGYVPVGGTQPITVTLGSGGSAQANFPFIIYIY